MFSPAWCPLDWRRSCLHSRSPSSDLTHCVTRGAAGRAACASKRRDRTDRRVTRLFGGVARRTIPGITRAAKVVLADALRPDPDARAALAAAVLACLDAPADP